MRKHFGCVALFIMMVPLFGSCAPQRNCQLMGAYSGLRLRLPAEMPEQYAAQLDVITDLGETVSIALECPMGPGDVHLVQSPIAGEAGVRCDKELGRNEVTWSTTGDTNEASQGPLPAQFVLTVRTPSESSAEPSSVDERVFSADEIDYRTSMPNGAGCSPTVEQARIQFD